MTHTTIKHFWVVYVDKYQKPIVDPKFDETGREIRNFTRST